MPNSFAYLMLAIWPLATGLLFWRLSLERAVIWTLLAGYLLLPPPPAAFDFPLLPPLNKETIPSLCVFVFAMLLHRQRLRILPESNIARGLLVIFILSPFATYLGNPEPLIFARTGLPGLRFVEAIALIVQQSMLVLPFLLGRSLFGSEDGQRLVLAALVAAAVVYSLPMLIEVRLSPRINVWVYGYFQHNFEQMVRFGGFRPIVFLYHGLWAAFFVMTAFIASLALFRGHPGGPGKGYFLVAGYLGVVLALCKSLGAALYGLLLIPLVLFLTRKMQLRLAALVAALVFAYPLLKQFDLVPVDQMVAQAEKIDAARAASLQFRFDNEDLLFERANEKPLFGWGTWGRNHLHDPVSGEIVTVTDGRWIITLGVFGWLGFLAEIGLLGLPIILLWRESERFPAKQVSIYLGPLALLMAVNLADLIPNATLTPITWLIAGVLLGAAETQHLALRKPAPDPLRTVL